MALVYTRKARPAGLLERQVPDHQRITNLAQFRSAIQATLVHDHPGSWVALQQLDENTLKFLGAESNGFDGLVPKMTEGACIHAYLLVKPFQVRNGQNEWISTKTLGPRQATVIQLCCVGKTSAITRAAAYRIHRGRLLTKAVPALAFGLLSDTSMGLQRLLTHIETDTSFNVVDYHTILPQKGCFTIAGVATKPFPLYLNTFVVVQPQVCMSNRSLSNTDVFNNAMRSIREGGGLNDVQEARKKPKYGGVLERRLPGLLPQLESEKGEKREIAQPRTPQARKSTSSVVPAPMQTSPRRANRNTFRCEASSINAALLTDNSFLDDLALPGTNSLGLMDRPPYVRKIGDGYLVKKEVTPSPAWGDIPTPQQTPQPPTARTRSLLIRNVYRQRTQEDIKENTRHDRSLSSTSITQSVQDLMDPDEIAAARSRARTPDHGIFKSGNSPNLSPNNLSLLDLNSAFTWSTIPTEVPYRIGSATSALSHSLPNTPFRSDDSNTEQPEGGIALSPSADSLTDQPDCISAYKPLLNDLAYEIRTFTNGWELSPQILQTLKALQAGAMTLISAINHAVNPTYVSVVLFEEAAIEDSNQTLTLQQATTNFQSTLVRLAISIVRGVSVDRGLVYSDLKDTVNAVAIYLPKKALTLLHTLILAEPPDDIPTLVSMANELVAFMGTFH
ncbi:hypothetical protein GMRT_13096 [Giardia muris]|uniref:Uncharacterized protein n=1 Tax=Giardia muris TaxID=5742 RepID=A0A4Z1T0J5_GIAMU|nr:hypothetical protein GMRT_13096 [Giardia muris]|eukprot:TNJ30505.1 hypothetical protein GMRT_13096 [Giardia muris]